MPTRTANADAPVFSWTEASADWAGLVPERLDGWWDRLAENNTTSIFVMRDDRIVFERFAEGFDRHRPHYTASLAKALVGGMSLLFAVNDGLMAFDDPAWRFVPEWKSDPAKSKITVRHLATHTSGLSDASVPGCKHTEEPGWKGEFWQRNQVPEDPFSLARDEAPVLFEPGTSYHYSNPGIAMLGYCVTRALQASSSRDIRTLLKERLMEPLEVPEAEWKCGYGEIFDVDGLPLVPTWGGGNYSVRATAAIIRLLMRKGAWGRDNLVSANVVEDALTNAGLAPCFHGYAWWVNRDGRGKKRFPDLPEDAFGGFGAEFQVGLGIPSLGLIIVRNGGNPALPVARSRRSGVSAPDRTLERLIFSPALGCLRVCKPAYPRSRLITGVRWDPICRVKRLATGGAIRDGSDNWPCTWADDGHIYTAYGDGNGFAPYTPNKLGMGFARITGGPERFVPANVRSNAENTSYGPNDRKASGLLSVDGTLYLLARNDNKAGRFSRIGWSVDRARTFQWCDWSFEELGHPTFINFGRDYTGARDEFAYIWSHDDPSAYDCADHFVLARVPKDRIRDRSAYEFFVRLRGKSPVWAPEADKRGPVFESAGLCMRSSVSYNAGLGRYILWQGLRQAGGIDARFRGGCAIFEAPEPWGPWRSVYFTDSWDIGPGELGCFPTKWMSRDGRTMYLVCSSDDHFTVRKMTLK